MMEDDVKEGVKHVCKFCDKSFPSGRQLGGHMRSHQNHINSVDADGVGNNKKKRRSMRMRLKESIDSGENSEVRVGLGFGVGSRSAYVLRENLRKSWRFAAEDVWTDPEKSCRECGRGFGSWKALFAHMKRHTLEDRDSRTGEDKGTVVEDRREDSWLDDEDEDEEEVEVAVANRRRRRSERRKRYMVVEASSSSLSLVNNNNNVIDDGNHNVASSVSEIDQEQEEVAIYLMMLSRDVGHRKAMDSIIPESSDAQRSLPDAVRGGVGIIGNSGSDNLELENEVQVQSQVNLTDFGSAKDSNSEHGFRTDPVEVKVSKTISRKRSLSSDLNDSDLKIKTQKEFEDDEGGFGLLTGLNSDKRSSFECIACNKVFHSYQALGGHKAGHSKIKDCSNGNIISETEISRPAKACKMIEKRVNGVAGKKHECPVCLKIFPSGQALGGHKRSHMQQGVAAKGAIARDLFDLNLPAQMEDERSSSHVTFNSLFSRSHDESF